jgi:hypothetical protein
MRSPLALLMILLAGPADAGSRYGGGFHGGPGGGFHGGPGGGFHGGGKGHPFAFHRSGGRIRGFIVGYGYGYGCGYGYDCGVYGNGYGYGGGGDYGYGYGGAGNAVTVSRGSTGGYVPDPVGADIPPMVVPTNCWVRRAAYDPSGAYFGPVLVNLCRSSGSGTVTALKAHAKAPDTGIAPDQPAPLSGSGAPQSPQ